MVLVIGIKKQAKKVGNEIKTMVVAIGALILAGLALLVACFA